MLGQKDNILQKENKNPYDRQRLFVKILGLCDKQTDMHTDKQTDRHIDRHINRHINMRAYRHTDIHTYRLTDLQIYV